MTTWGPRRLLGLVVLKLNVQTVLDPNLHLDGRVQLWVCAECMNYNVHLFDNIIEAAADGGSKEVPELHILPCIGLIRLLHMGEFKVEGLRLGNFSRPGQVLHQGHKFMVVPAVVVEFWRESIGLLYQTPSYSGPSKGLQDAGTPLL